MRGLQKCNVVNLLFGNRQTPLQQTPPVTQLRPSEIFSALYLRIDLQDTTVAVRTSI